MGKIVELTDGDRLYSGAKHPYTQALLSAIPSLDPAQKSKRVLLPGDVPTPANVPEGCSFHTRCPHAKHSTEITSPRVEPVPGSVAAQPVTKSDMKIRGGCLEVIEESPSGRQHVSRFRAGTVFRTAWRFATGGVKVMLAASPLCGWPDIIQLDVARERQDGARVPALARRAVSWSLEVEPRGFAVAIRGSDSA